MKYNLICFGYNPWSSFWKRNQIIVNYLQQENFIDKVLFINPSIWFSNSLSNPQKEFSPLRKAYWNSVIPRKVNIETTVYTPLYLPKLSKYTEKITQNIIKKYTCNPYLLLINKPMELDSGLAQLMDAATLTIFDWSDDFAQFAYGNDSVSSVQNNINKIINHSDIVFAVNDSLTSRAKEINENSHCVRNATNMAMFQNEVGESVASVSDKCRPVIGYSGWLVEDRLDRELIHFCARNLPEFDFVFIGPKVSDDPLGISYGPKNIHYREPVPYIELADVLNEFDVCIIPNKVNEHTKGNDPIKIYDYLFLGKAVVTTNTAGVDEFKHLISIVNNKEEFKEALCLLVSENSVENVNERKNAGIKHSWDQKIEHVIGHIKKGLKFNEA
ncbi:MAG: hypothetical protein ACI93P_000742 [bacterium]|jgi:hypothetical protein